MVIGDPQAVSAEARLQDALRHAEKLRQLAPNQRLSGDKALIALADERDALLARVAEAERERRDAVNAMKGREGYKLLIDRAERAEAEAERRGELLREWLAKPVGAFDWSLAEQTRAALRGGDTG